jgi:hypothetical protein
MFSTLLSSIQTALSGIVSKNFVLAALFPTLLAAVVNGLFLWATGVPVNKLSDDIKTTQACLVLLALLTVAYLLSSLSTFLLETLEGRHLPPFVEALFYSGQYRKLEALNGAILSSTEQVLDLVLAADPPAAFRRGPGWKERLAAASVQGQAAASVQGQTSAPAHCTYPRQAREAPKDHVYRKLRDLETRREHGLLIQKNDLEESVRGLEAELRANDETVVSGPADENPLKKDREQMIRLVAYARDRYKHELLRLQNYKQFTYPGEIQQSEGRSSANILAPTLFGNIGRTMRSYALTRYGIDLDLFWTRLLRSIQNGSGGTDKFYQNVQDAKTQVDFLVAMTYICALTAIGWIAGLLYDDRHPWLFLGVAAGGPAVIYTFYLLACQSYRVFADSVRTSVDMYRFQLLSDLKVAMPAGSREEQALWETLGGRTGYDTGADLSYMAKS